MTHFFVEITKKNWQRYNYKRWSLKIFVSFFIFLNIPQLLFLFFYFLPFRPIWIHFPFQYPPQNILIQHHFAFTYLDTTSLSSPPLLTSWFNISLAISPNVTLPFDLPPLHSHDHFEKEDTEKEEAKSEEASQKMIIKKVQLIFQSLFFFERCLEEHSLVKWVDIQWLVPKFCLSIFSQASQKSSPPHTFTLQHMSPLIVYHHTKDKKPSQNRCILGHFFLIFHQK